MNLSIYKNLKVLVTGSTGFKGSWLCYWLNEIGAKVVGVSLRPEKNSILYKSLKPVSQNNPININTLILDNTFRYYYTKCWWLRHFIELNITWKRYNVKF